MLHILAQRVPSQCRLCLSRRAQRRREGIQISVSHIIFVDVSSKLVAPLHSFLISLASLADGGTGRGFCLKCLVRFCETAGRRAQEVISKFDLRQGKDEQTYGLGLKEVWRVPKDKCKPG